MSKRKIVLAYSGGLDTSYCVLDLVDRGFEVHTAFVDTGGFDSGAIADLKSRAMVLGATRHWTLDGASELWSDFVVPLIWSHARTQGQYPMLCSDRYLIVKRCLDLCQALETKYFAHGCTAMGNDQMRFDTSVMCLGEFEIIAPIRELQAEGGSVREREMAALAEAGISIAARTSRYSVNENLLGVTISGSEIDQFAEPAEDVYELTRSRADWPEEPLDFTIGFEQGVARFVDGVSMSGPKLLAELNKRCGAYGIGRHIYTGDVVIGLKGRIVFECPGVDALQMAHRALEDAVNTRWQNQFRHIIGQRWGELVYGGFFFEPHKRDLERMLSSSQSRVTGTVTLKSHGGSLLATRLESKWILTSPDATYAQHAAWTPQEAEGFIKLSAQSSRLWARMGNGANGGVSHNGSSSGNTRGK